MPQKSALKFGFFSKIDFFSTWAIKQKFLHQVRNFCKKIKFRILLCVIFWTQISPFINTKGSYFFVKALFFTFWIKSSFCEILKNTTFTKKVWTFFIYEWIYLGPKYDTTQKSKYQKRVKGTFFCTFLGVLIWVVIVHKYFFRTTNSQKVITLSVFCPRIRYRLTIGSPCSYKQKLWLKIRVFFLTPPPVLFIPGGEGSPKLLLGFSKDFWPAAGGKFFGYIVKFRKHTKPNDPRALTLLPKFYPPRHARTSWW